MKTGCAQIEITPTEPVYLTGYANRDHRSEGVYAPLYAGAIYLQGEDDAALIITADVIGYTAPYDAALRQAISDVTGLLPRQIVLTATHTHCAPFFTPWNMPGAIESAYADYLTERCQVTELGARQLDHHISQDVLPGLSLELLKRMGDKNIPNTVHLSLDESGKYDFSFA